MHRRIAPALITLFVCLVVVSPALADTIYLPLTGSAPIPTVTAIPPTTNTPTMTSSPTMTPSATPLPEGIVNGGFENGKTGWSFGGDAEVFENANFAHTGQFSALLGLNDDTLAQHVTIPSGKPYLHYWSLALAGQEPCGIEIGTVSVTDSRGTKTVKTIDEFCYDREHSNHLRTTIDLSAYRGKLVTLRWTFHSPLSTDDQLSEWDIDDVSLDASK